MEGNAETVSLVTNVSYHPEGLGVSVKEKRTKLFVQKELDIRGSRNALPGNFRRVIDFAARGLFPISKMISRIYPFDEAGKALQDWHESPAKVCRYLISLD